MEIKDLGGEAIDEILAEAIDGMHRRTGKAWGLELDGEHGDLKIKRDGRHVTTANVRPRPFLKPVENSPVGGMLTPAQAVLRYRSNLRRLVIEATEALTPVPGASDVPAALTMAYSAIQALDAADERKDLAMLPAVRHHLYRILDELTGCDHSGCSTKPSVADYGRELAGA